MKRTKQQIVKLICSIEVSKEDWGYRVDYPSLGLVATDETEQGAIDKIEKEIARQLDYGLTRGDYKRIAKKTPNKRSCTGIY